MARIYVAVTMPQRSVRSEIRLPICRHQNVCMDTSAKARGIATLDLDKHLLRAMAPQSI